MGRANRDVGGYRGRRTVTDILKLIAIILGVLVVLAVAGMLYLQRYLVYTDEGVKLELPPFLQSLRGEDSSETPGGSASLPDPGSVSVVVEPDGSGSEPVQPVETERPTFVLALPVSDVAGGSAAAKLEEAGADQLVLAVKTQDGKLAWPSGQTAAERSHVNGSQQTADALRQWNQGEVYTIARVCCFRDDSAPYFNNAMALRQGNGNWRDELGLRWLSPANDRSQAYIAGLCGELAGLGFDEIVLEDFTFPTKGKVDRINRGESYDPARLTAEMEDFLAQVQRTVEPYGTKISLRVERDTLAGAETLSGVTPQLLEKYAARIWVEDDGLTPAPQDLLEQAGISGGADRLVLVTAAYSEDGSVTQAVLFPAEQ